MDVLSRTIIFFVLSLVLDSAATWEVALVIYSLTLFWASAVRVPILVFLAATLVPIPPITVSYFIIEPFPTPYPIPWERCVVAATAWLRLSGMTLLSIAWAKGLGIRELAQLANALGLGQYLFSLVLMTSSILRVANARWQALRESLCLERTGRLRQRAKVRIRDLVPLGLQLTLTSLVMTTDMALSAQGRGIGNRRTLAARVRRPSIIGLLIIVVLFLGIAAILTLKGTQCLHC